MWGRIATLFFLVYAAGQIAADGTSSQSCDTTRHPDQPATRLRKELFCNYDMLERPVKDYRNATTVSVLLWLKSIDIAELNHGNHVYIHAWTAWSWKDEFLTWDASTHQGVTYFHVESKSIWIPAVVLQNPTGVQSMDDFLRNGRCMVHQDGMVSCVISSTYETHCASDMAPWPFDTHKCGLMLLAVNDTYGNNVDIGLLNDGYSSLEYVPNREWQLLGVKAENLTYRITNNAMATGLNYELTIKRHTAKYAATLFTSALVLFVMTASSFWINPESLARLSLCCMNVFIQCLYLQHLQYVVGPNGDTCPRIILYYRDSMVLAIMALVVAVIVLRLSCSSDTPPAWCSRALLWTIDNRVGQVILVGSVRSKVITTQISGDEEAATIDVENSEDINIMKYPTDKWIFLVGILDRIIFYVVFLVYIILLIVRVS